MPLEYSSVRAPRLSLRALAAVLIGVVALGAAGSTLLIAFVPGAGVVVPLAASAGVFGLIALQLGWVAMRRTADGRLRGRGLGLIGVLFGVTATAAALFFGVIAWQDFRRERIESAWSDCHNRLFALGGALRQYADDNGAFPPDLQGFALLDGRPADEFIYPDGDRERPSFLYVGGGLSKDVPLTTVIAYEPLGHHESGHRQGAHFLLADRNVYFLPPGQGRAMIVELEKGLNPPPSGPSRTARDLDEPPAQSHAIP